MISASLMLVFLIWASRHQKKLRRLQNWYLWFPIQRTIHRLFKSKRRRWRGWMMAKWKKSVVADIIDDALFDALVAKRISPHDYYELCKKIGDAIEVTEILPRGKYRNE